MDPGGSWPGAVTLAALETEGLISRGTSDVLGIATALGGVGLGALVAYAARPASQAASSRGHDRPQSYFAKRQ